MTSGIRRIRMQSFLVLVFHWLWLVRLTEGFVLRTALSTPLSLTATKTQDASEAHITHKEISNLRFRELKRQLEIRGELNTEGTTSELRQRLREIVFPGEECLVNPASGEEECGPDLSVRRMPTEDGTL